MSDVYLFIIGANLQLNDHSALVTENWLVLAREQELDQQPCSLALRFFGQHIAADVGIIYTPDMLAPWLSFAYYFGG